MYLSKLKMGGEAPVDSGSATVDGAGGGSIAHKVDTR